MLTQFNSSTWREDNISIESGEVFDLNFIDTKPNMFYVQNPNNDELKISISSIPNKKSYEFVVHSNSCEPIGRPTGTGHLYILNTGTTSAKVKVYSIADKFDMNILKNFVVSLSGVTVEAQQEIKFAEGVALPSGTNNIGVVSLKESLENDITKMDENVRTIALKSEKMNDITEYLSGVSQHITKMATEGIGAQINGDVNLNIDSFYKEVNVDHNNRTWLGENIANDSVKLENCINNKRFIKANELKNITGITLNSPNFIIGTVNLDLRYVDGTLNVILSGLESAEFSVNPMPCLTDESVKYLDIKEIFSSIEIESKHLETPLIGDYFYKYNDILFSSNSNNKLYYYDEDKWTTREVSGILYNCRRVKNWGKSGNFTVENGRNRVIEEKHGSKIADKIHSLKADNDSIICRIYTSSNGAPLNFSKLQSFPIENLEMEIYKLEFISGTVDGTIQYLGGLY